MDLNYLMSSDFIGLKSDDYIKLLVSFRNYYRVLVSNNINLGKDLQIAKMQIDDTKLLLSQIDTKYLMKIAALEDELHFTKNSLNKKLTLKERITGKLNRKNNI